MLVDSPSSKANPTSLRWAADSHSVNKRIEWCATQPGTVTCWHCAPCGARHGCIRPRLRTKSQGLLSSPPMPHALGAQPPYAPCPRCPAPYAPCPRCPTPLCPTECSPRRGSWGAPHLGPGPHAGPMHIWALGPMLALSSALVEEADRVHSGGSSTCHREGPAP